MSGFTVRCGRCGKSADIADTVCMVGTDYGDRRHFVLCGPCHKAEPQYVPSYYRWAEVEVDGKVMLGRLVHQPHFQPRMVNGARVKPCLT